MCRNEHGPAGRAGCGAALGLKGQQPEGADKGLLYEWKGSVQNCRVSGGFEVDHFAQEPAEECGVAGLGLDLRGDMEFVFLGCPGHELGQVDLELAAAMQEACGDPQEGLALLGGERKRPVVPILAKVQIEDIPAVPQVLPVQQDERRRRVEVVADGPVPTQVVAGDGNVVAAEQLAHSLVIRRYRDVDLDLGHSRPPHVCDTQYSLIVSSAHAIRSAVDVHRVAP